MIKNNYQNENSYYTQLSNREKMQHIQSIHFFPIKGLQGFELEEYFLRKNNLLDNDRRFALTQSLIKKETTLWLPKSHFKQLVNQPSLAKIRLSLISQNPLTLKIEGFREKFNLTHSAGKDAFIKAITNPTSSDANANLNLLEAKNGGLSDTRSQWISVGASASANKLIRAFSLDESYFRFRLNIWIKTDTPFEEFNWVGRKAKIGSAEIEFKSPIGRCNAINVSAKTGDITNQLLPQKMRAYFGHSNLGVFAQVIKSGNISQADKLILK